MCAPADNPRLLIRFFALLYKHVVELHTNRIGLEFPSGHNNDAAVSRTKVRHPFTGPQATEPQHPFDYRLGSRIIGGEDLDRLFLSAQRRDEYAGEQDRAIFHALTIWRGCDDCQRRAGLKEGGPRALPKHCRSRAFGCKLLAPAAEWSEPQIRSMVTDSAWAKQAHITIRGTWNTSRTPWSETDSDDPTSATPIIVRWESAASIREACAAGGMEKYLFSCYSKLMYLSGQSKEFGELADSYYVVSISNFPGGTPAGARS